jgi:hypothetical protein
MPPPRWFGISRRYRSWAALFASAPAPIAANQNGHRSDHRQTHHSNHDGRHGVARQSTNPKNLRRFAHRRIAVGPATKGDGRRRCGDVRQHFSRSWLDGGRTSAARRHPSTGGGHDSHRIRGGTRGRPPIGSDASYLGEADGYRQGRPSSAGCWPGRSGSGYEFGPSAGP